MSLLTLALTAAEPWQAIGLHDRVLRSLMLHYHGYEVCTEVGLVAQLSTACCSGSPCGSDIASYSESSQFRNNGKRLACLPPLLGPSAEMMAPHNVAL